MAVQGEVWLSPLSNSRTFHHPKRKPCSHEEVAPSPPWVLGHHDLLSLSVDLPVLTFHRNGLTRGLESGPSHSPLSFRSMHMRQVRALHSVPGPLSGQTWSAHLPVGWCSGGLSAPAEHSFRPPGELAGAGRHIPGVAPPAFLTLVVVCAAAFPGR